MKNIVIKHKYTCFTQKGETVPNLSLSVRDILHQYSNGQLVVHSYQSIDDDQDLTDEQLHELQPVHDFFEAQEVLDRLNDKAKEVILDDPPAAEGSSKEVNPEITSDAD